MSANFDLILLAVKEQTSEFKKFFLQTVKKNAERAFDKIPIHIAEMNSNIAAVDNELKSISASYTNQYGGITSMKLFYESSAERRLLYEKRDKFNKKLVRLVKDFSLGKDNFVLRELNEASNSFDGKVYSLSARLDKKSFDPKNILFSNISNDPKMFDVYISSGNNRVHARSVLAAENSDCMIAHFRFIITNAKIK